MLNWLRKSNDSIPRETERLSAYLDDALPAGERDRLERQLRHDNTLRAELDELRRTAAMLRETPAVPLPRSFVLDPAVYGQKVRPRAYYFPALRFAAVASTLLFVALFAGGILLGGTGRNAATTEIAMEPALMMVQETVAVEQEAGALRETAPSALEMEAPAAEEALEMDTAAVESAPAEPPMAAELAVEVTPEVEMAGEAPTEAPAAKIVGEAPTLSAEEIAMTAAPPGMGGAATGEQATATPTLPDVTPEPVEAAEALVPATPMATAAAAMPQAASPTLAATLYAIPLQPEEPPSIDEPAAAEGQLANTADEAQAPTPEPTPSSGRTTNWLELAQVAAGLLAIGLLVLTVIARRLNW